MSTSVSSHVLGVNALRVMGEVGSVAIQPWKVGCLVFSAIGWVGFVAGSELFVAGSESLKAVFWDEYADAERSIDSWVVSTVGSAFMSPFASFGSSVASFGIAIMGSS